MCHDHDLCELDQSDHMLVNENLISISKEQIKNIEQSTQHHNAMWYKERLKRIHSTSFKRIVKLTDRTDKVKLSVQLMTPSPKLRTRAVRHGLQFENKALKMYELKQKTTVKEVGIVVCKDTPYLAATPDGILEDGRVIEVKCPFTAKDQCIDPTSVPFFKYDNNVLTLKEDHQYMYQIQGQMMATGASQCDLVVYTHKDYKIINIKRNNTFILDMSLKLESYYNDYFQPQYLKMHFYKDCDKYMFD